MQHTEAQKLEQEKECGIFEFGKKEWKKIVSLEYEWKYHEFVCITAYDGADNIIYLQSNIESV